MTKTSGNTYSCPICKLTYKQKLWAVKCRKWCSTHPSCNLEIAKHSKEANSKNREVPKIKNNIYSLTSKFLTPIFYLVISIASMLALFIFYDFLLTRTSSITTFYLNAKDTPFYMWYYIISTILALFLFGVDVSATVYLLRKTGAVGIKAQGGNATGVIFGAFAASCPVCTGVLLSLIGITGGLAAFPFKGLELKTLSVIFLALPLFFLLRRIKNPNCDGKCPVPKDASFKKKDITVLLALLLFLFAEILLAYSLVRPEPVVSNLFRASSVQTGYSSSYTTRVKQVLEEVNPKKGYTSRIILGNIVPKMVSYGIIDISKMQQLYQGRGGIPKEEMDFLTKTSNTPLIINANNANWVVNLLWGIGLSNYMEINKQSPVNGPNVNNFASTGGWILGKKQNGGDYFNKFPLIVLNSQQQRRVKAIAESIYRPCCDNSAFFQDCNHGSAAMALIEMGVSQGLSDKEIYKTILAFNSFWFPQNYTETALYFNVIKNTDWNNVDSKLVLSKDYSSITGWMTNVDPAVRKVSGLLPQQKGGGSCGA